jgi:nucleoside-diphosphate-sugar epimerase
MEVDETPLTGTYLVTGAYGCLGAWVMRELARRGATAVAFDLADDAPRLALVLDGDEPGALHRVRGDVTDRAQVERALDEHEVDRVIHLAALQVPFCRADPPRGAAVNVVGTVNVLAAAARRRARIPHVAYASSIAAYDAYVPGVAPAMTGLPSTIYGVFKRANEQSAARLCTDEGVSSIGLRPHTVFGAGRDQGLTSAPTTAMLAAAAGRAYAIPYGGRAQLQYARDVAAAFVAASSVEGYEGASVHDLPGAVVGMDEVAAAIARAAPAAPPIGFGAQGLPFPEDTDSSSVHAVLGALEPTPLDAAVAETVGRFRRALADGRVTTAALDAGA